ncbi:NUDIX hydrolase [Clostridium folliculivorans]|uniref:ADP-ribose pyrophosphatase n=1 Tax=Clostridium folliculivorans TaxID=2886038 RepID=A0A9W5XZT8_9CLOT|nr:NUDIX domain-containing protein [Clostridium folliculivorans]GKU23915.1 ADP-ribose pyrophosphatase [Clostridium folliculivorans]GKU30030.1 ADP-ribose pyrophosphatase [Clostridium folliculivorans]
MDKHFIDNEAEFLKNYDVNQYERPSVTNDVIIFTTDDIKEANQRKVPKKGMQVLLVKRDEYPDKGKWSIPGGFIDINEGLKEGAKRKLREKTGVEDVYIEQLYTFGDINRDKRTRVISIGNMALIEKEIIRFEETNELKESKWFWIDKVLVETNKSDRYIENNHILTLKSEDDKVEVKYQVIEKIDRNIYRRKEINYIRLDESTENLAFDHYKILDYAVDRLRNKVEYTPIAFNLLPRLFTVKELQNVYEAIMGREILNFRRKMEDMIIETDEKIEGKPFRPAKVFKFNENWEHNF